MRKSKKYIRRNQKRGLILLIVLGMLAMFTLLAVTYVVTAGASRSGSIALTVKARNSNLSISGTARNVLKDAIRGTNNQKSPFYNTSLIGDVFGPNPIKTQFGPFVSANSARRFSGTGVNLVKLSVNANAQLNGPLSDLENEYNSRIITILEGPLTGQSFRILKYVGFVRGASGGTDFNIDQTPWSNRSYTDAQAADIQYSILIDLDEVVGTEFTGEYTDTNGTVKSISLSLNKWINLFNNNVYPLFYFKTTAPSVPATTNTMIGYKFLINDAPFNSPGIGLEDIAVSPIDGVIPGYGNLDGRRTLGTSRKVPPALLTHYDYLQDPNIMAVNADGTRGVDGIGVHNRDWTQASAYSQFALTGSSNEGYDVPDYRDPWLAHQSFAGGQYTIKPSYHNPEVINYLSNLYGSASAMTPVQVNEMLRLIDASTARVLRYPGKNTGFRENDPSHVYLSQPYTTLQLQNFVRNQIVGNWDVDNDGDTIADSVWIDPGMQVVFSPDGRRLRPLAAVLIEDLDGRVNLNTSGDRVQGNFGYDSVANIGFDVTTNAYYKRANQRVAQGFGYGPAEISLTALFEFTGSLLLPSGSNYDPPPITAGHYSNRFSFFDELAGARRYTSRPIIFPYVNDRVPGMARSAAYPDPSFSALLEREFHVSTQHNRLPGMPMSRRSTFGMSFDRNGNPAFVNPGIVDGDPYNVNNTNPASFVNETRNDKYESAAMENPIADDPLGLRDLETILRRFDEDAASLPPRLREKLALIPGYNNMNGLNREVTVRSGELRYPNLATAMKMSPPNATLPQQLTIAGQTPGTATPSYLRYIQLLHSQRYRNQSFPPAATDDPVISYATLAELFPMDFAKGLKMDLNRPFGNGYDDDGDGQVDEPNELVNDNLWMRTNGYDDDGDGVIDETMPYESASLNQEQFPVGSSFVTPLGAYTRDVKPDARKANALVTDPILNANAFTSETRGRLGSRQILARNLYCLAQLIIPRDFEFPGMSLTTNPLLKARIRATAIAQWSVNVVDFRDADAAMTRFEFDILPFGTGPMDVPLGQLQSPLGTSTDAVRFSRLAYWAPDRIQHTVNGVNTVTSAGVTIANKKFVGVVWGMEMPELLLTETLAMHDKRLRDTDMDTTGKATNDPMSPDDDFDQYRFPLASLFLELYNPRTTAAGTNALIPGVPSSLYNSGMQLQLDKRAPISATWGQQPIWRIAISEMYPASPISTDHPQSKLSGTDSTNRAFETTTHQWSTEQVQGGTAAPLPIDTVLEGARDIDRTNTSLQFIEQYIGNDLRYDLADQSTPPPKGFERFIWFTDVRPTATQPIPDILSTIRTAGRQRESVYTASAAGAALGGGSYLVIGPRGETNIGSLTHNQFTGNPYPTVLNSSAMTAPSTVRPILSPSYQKIDLTGNNVVTNLIDNSTANLPWRNLSKTPQPMICTTPAPTTGGWATSFTGGIGINISMPPPIDGQTIWTTTAPRNHLPNMRLNASDTGPRVDGSNGFGSTVVPPDSWIDVSATPIVNALPDTPIDTFNPVLTGRLRTGTYENVRAAYLQRLADPDFAYDPVTNPYITVDWMSIDLTVFNGEAPFPGSPGADPNDQVPSAPNLVRFQSRYKNGKLSPLAADHDIDVRSDTGISYHSPMTGDLKLTVPQTGIPNITVPMITPPVDPSSYFMHQLGYNKDYTVPVTVPPTARVVCSATTLGYCNVGYYTGNTTAPPATVPDMATVDWTQFDGFGPPINDPSALPAYRGAPARLAGVTWFNRPFASPYELMMVPLTGPSLFGLHHSACTTVQNRELNGFVPSYQTTNAWNVDLATLPNANPPSLNSYWAKPEAVDLNTTTRLADWPLLLEFVETQPPFIDANKFYRADTMLSLASTDTVAARFLNSYLPPGYTIQDGAPNNIAGSEPYTVRGPSLLAPFNTKPSYVAAGKINLNTIAFDSAMHSRALKAIEHNYLAGERSSVLDSLAASFATSRQGFVTARPNTFFNAVVHPAMDPYYPTRFVGAFRPAMSSNLAPALADPVANQKMRSRYGVETTLLRSLNLDTNNKDLGPRSSTATLQGADLDRPMLFQATQVETTDRLDATQPFVRMQRAMRLPNLVTNQSNVFAVWVTVSLFEYDPISGFGNEYVGDTGLPERERQFFIVDRTIPVGFKPGEDLNTDRTILLQRKLP